jgi:hypothetical protein
VALRLPKPSARTNFEIASCAQSSNGKQARVSLSNAKSSLTSSCAPVPPGGRPEARGRRPSGPAGPACWAILIGVCLLAGPVAGRNLLENPGFEQGVKGWEWPGATWTISTTREDVHSGKQAARVSNRTAEEQGLNQSIRAKPAPDQTYICSGWVQVEGAPMAQVSMVLKKVDESNQGNPSYYVLARANAFSNHWTRLEGNIRLQITGQLRSLEFYFQGPPAGVNLLVDDTAIEPYRVLPSYWPVAGLLPVLAGACLFGLLTKRRRWAALAGVALLALFVILITSTYTVLQKVMLDQRRVDRSQDFKGLGFENVVKGRALEIKDEVRVPTLYQASGVRIYGTCTTNVAIVARLAEIHGRIEGKLYFRGNKLVIARGGELVNGLDAQGFVYRLGKINGPVTGSYRIIDKTESAATTTNTVEQ